MRIYAKILLNAKFLPFKVYPVVRNFKSRKLLIFKNLNIQRVKIPRVDIVVADEFNIIHSILFFFFNNKSIVTIGWGVLNPRRRGGSTF